MPPSPPVTSAQTPTTAPHYGTTHSSASSYTAASTAPPRQTRASSAFSRLANIALTGATGAAGTSTTHTPPFLATTTGAESYPSTSTSTSRGGALDALETIAHADQDRWKDKTGTSTSTSTSAAAAAGATRTGSASRYEPRTRSSGSRTGWRARDLSESRSRERRPPLTFGDVSGGSTGGGGGGGYLAGVTESPSSTSYRTGWAGGEQLPPNASASAFSAFGSGAAAPGESHFFPHGSSAFSFETSGVSVSPWDSSYRSSATGSPSLFEASRSSSIPRQSSSRVASPVEQPRSDPTTTTATSLGFRPDQAHSGPSSRSPSSAPSLARTSSPVGGGRKPKEASRALRYSVPTAARDKGLVGLAKPPRDAASSEQQGRVAVAGKTSLKILRVPYGRRMPRDRDRDRDDPAGMDRSARAAEAVQSAFPASSIAARRSRSRGSPAPGTQSTSIRDGSTTRTDEDGEASREVVTEVMDVRLGSKLGPTYLFSDVRWGYGATSNKIATSFSNGAVVLWDLTKEGSRLDQLKYEHDRAVNRVVFGGQTGNWLMSGGQDGQMKLWDIRESRPASMILKASSPIRHLAFSPSASQPFTLVAACASGTMIRYDVRYVSRQNGGATDRIAGHVGACLAMDWRDGFSCERDTSGTGVGSTAETAGGGREGGWVVTGGVDRTVKIWDFSLPTLSTKPVRTLYTSQPVYSVAWHPTRPTELASSPMPSLGLGAESSSSSSVLGDEIPSTPISTADSPLAALIKGDPPASRARTDRNAWKNEIEVWDVRRPYFPKLAIKTDEPISSLLYNDDETIWATSKGSPTFQQIDIASDSYSLLDSIDRPTSSWNLEGDFAFLDDGRRWNDVPFDRPIATPVDAAKFRPDAFINTVPQFDPDFSVDIFAFLADNLRLSGDLNEVCEHNAEISRQAGRSDASQLWLTLRTWLSDDSLAAASAPAAETLSPVVLVQDMASESAATAAKSQETAPPFSSSEQAVKVRRLSDSSSQSRPSRQSSANGTPRMMRRSGHPTPAQPTSRSRLDSFAEETTTSESDLPDRVVDFPELGTTSSDSEDGRLDRIRDFNAKRLAASLSALDADGKSGSRSRSSSGAQQGLGIRARALVSPVPGEATLSAAAGDFAVSSSSSDSELDDEDYEAGAIHGDPPRRSRSAKIASMHASLIASRSRRPSSGQNTDGSRPGRQSRESTLPVSPIRNQRDRSKPRQSSNHGSSNRFGARLHSVDVSVGESSRQRQASKETGKSAVATVESLKLAFGVQQVAELRARIHERIKTVLMEYADRGDAQLCATICPLLHLHGIRLDSVWVARVTKTYLDLLRRLDLHVAAAHLSKVCNVDSLQALTQDTVVFHTSCGSCGRANDRSPHGFCARCRSQVTRCCVCHLAVESLFLFCVGCGHGAHLACLGNLSAAPSHESASAPNTPLQSSHPSTPGIGTPMQRWLWGDGGGQGHAHAAGDRLQGTAAIAAGDRTPLEQTGPGWRQPAAHLCPAACGHSPCELSQLALSVL
ncbi:hypothetical protein JCM10908_004089 [Rhodotorula pacifica]|uniref:uncharacterized protein n=1 Tax=Rhodotorula pacifica TaxID=1495444 RepID=UPI00318185DF